MQCKARDCSKDLPTPRRHNQKYCCTPCSKRERSKLEREARNQYSGPLTCAMPGCENTFTQNKGRSKRYCHRTCTLASRRLYKPRTIEVACEYCGGPFKRSQKSTRRFCSPPCRKDGQIQNGKHKRRSKQACGLAAVALQEIEQRRAFKARMRLLAHAREYAEQTGVHVSLVVKMLTGEPRTKYGKRFAPKAKGE